LEELVRFDGQDGLTTAEKSHIGAARDLLEKVKFRITNDVSEQPGTDKKKKHLLKKTAPTGYSAKPNPFYLDEAELNDVL